MAIDVEIIPPPHYCYVCMSAPCECNVSKDKTQTAPAQTTANERQHGGTHYKKRPYQHWDWVCDIGLPYLLGCATKYVARWRDKNGKEDLLKAIHYLEKAMERKIESRPSWQGRDSTKFIEQMENQEDKAVLHLICTGSFDEAVLIIKYSML